MAHSHQAKSLWREVADEAAVLLSNVRWWSRMERAIKIAKHIGSQDMFLRKLDGESVGHASMKGLLAILF